MQRQSASPAAAVALWRMATAIDVRDVLPVVHVPTLVLHLDGDLLVNPGCGRHLAACIEGAPFVALPGADHNFCISVLEPMQSKRSLLAGSSEQSPTGRDVEQTHARVTITKHGHPAAILIAPDDLASLEETLDIRSDPDALADIREAESEASRGEYSSAEEILLLIDERRRRESGAA